MRGRARVQIDVGALRSNLLGVREACAGGPEVCAVLKADAYGHGLDLVLPLVSEAGFTTVGIASNEEAGLARRMGFSGRLIRVRAAAPAEAAEAAPFGVEEWIGGFLHARAVAEIAISRGAEIPVHLALNSTGHSKECLDLRGPGGVEELEALLRLRGLDIRGICAHFPMENAEDTAAGAVAFAAEASEVLSRIGPERAAGVQRHCATSYATFAVPESRLDLVRIGAALYGDSSAGMPWQRRAMRVVAPIATVNAFTRGSTVGYDREYVLDRDSVVATVPIGYGDGISRSLARGGEMIVRGRRVPIIDCFGMNTLALDVTSVPGVLPGDEAVLYGHQGAQEVTAADLEEATGEIAAVSYTRWGRIMPREGAASAAWAR